MRSVWSAECGGPNLRLGDGGSFRTITEPHTGMLGGQSSVESCNMRSGHAHFVQDCRHVIGEGVFTTPNERNGIGQTERMSHGSGKPREFSAPSVDETQGQRRLLDQGGT